MIQIRSIRTWDPLGIRIRVVGPSRLSKATKPTCLTGLRLVSPKTWTMAPGSRQQNTKGNPNKLCLRNLHGNQTKTQKIKGLWPVDKPRTALKLRTDGNPPEQPCLLHFLVCLEMAARAKKLKFRKNVAKNTLRSSEGPLTRQLPLTIQGLMMMTYVVCILRRKPMKILDHEVGGVSVSSPKPPSMLHSYFGA